MTSLNALTFFTQGSWMTIDSSIEIAIDTGLNPKNYRASLLPTDEAIKQAIQKALKENNTELLKNFMAVPYEQLHHRSLTFSVALREGHVDFAVEMIQKSFLLSDRREDFCYAAEQGYLDVVDKLLDPKYDFFITPQAKVEACQNAAGQGHLEVIKRICEKSDRFIAGQCQAAAIKSAAYTGHLHVVEGLCDGFEISSEDLGLAVQSAALMGHVAIVKKLFENSANISSYYLGRAIQSGAQNGHLEVIETLMPYYKSISSYLLAEALKSAASYGHLKIVQFLLNKMPKPRETLDTSLISSALDQAFANAVEKGYCDIVKAFIETNSFSKDFIQRCLWSAIDQGHFFVFKLLRDNCCLSEAAKKSLLQLATLKGYQNFIVLLKDPV